MNDRVRSRPIKTGEESHVISNDNKGHEDHMDQNEQWYGDAVESEEDTAGEGVDTPPVDSVTTDGYTDHLDPIDFIETQPRDYGRHHHQHPFGMSHPQGYSHSFDKGVGVVGRGVICEAQYEKWSMIMQMEDGNKKGKLAKRAKPPRVQKSERMRTPYQVPRQNKLGKPQHIHPRPSPLSRKRRLSVRLARPAQVLSVSEEGDMAQADEMGEGEGRDDGFVEGLDSVGRRRNKKRTGATHALLPPMGRSSPPSSPSNTPVSRRRASSRKSRPKTRCRKQGKPQLASADISTQESTTQGPGSSDTSDATYPEDGGTVVHASGEVVINSDEEEEEEYEEEEDGDEGRSLTPNLTSPSINVANNSAHFHDSDDLTNGLLRKAGVADIHLVQPTSIKSIIHSNNNDFSREPNHHHGYLSASSTIPRKDGRRWTVQKQESDLSTAPFSSETSDMDTSGNERVVTADSLVDVSSDVHSAQSPKLNRECSDGKGVCVVSKKGKLCSSGDKDVTCRSNLKKPSKLIPEKPPPPHVAAKKVSLNQRYSRAHLSPSQGPSLGPTILQRRAVLDTKSNQNRVAKLPSPSGSTHNSREAQDQCVQPFTSATLPRTLATASSRGIGSKPIVGARLKPLVTPKPIGLKPAVAPKKPHLKVGPGIGGGGRVEPVKPPQKPPANHRYYTGASANQLTIEPKSNDAVSGEASAGVMNTHGVRKMHNVGRANSTLSLAQKPVKVLPKKPVKGTPAEKGGPVREKGPNVLVRQVSFNPPLPPHKPSLPAKPRKISEKRYHINKPQPINLPCSVPSATHVGMSSSVSSVTDIGLSSSVSSVTDVGVSSSVPSATDVVELGREEVVVTNTTSIGASNVISAIAAPSLSNSSSKNLSSSEVTTSGQSQSPIASPFSPIASPFSSPSVSKRSVQPGKAMVPLPDVMSRRMLPLYATPRTSGGVGRSESEGDKERRGREVGEKLEKVGESGREVGVSGGEVRERGGEVGENGGKERGGEGEGNEVEGVSKRGKERSKSEEDKKAVILEAKDELTINLVATDTVEVTHTANMDPVFSMSEVSLTESPSPSPSPLPSPSDVSTDQNKLHEDDHPNAISDSSSEGEEATPPPIPPRRYLMSTENIAALDFQTLKEEPKPLLSRTLSKGPRRPPPSPPKTTPITDATPTSNVSTSVGGRQENNPAPSVSNVGAARKIIPALGHHYKLVDDLHISSSTKESYFEKHSSREAVQAVNYSMVDKLSISSQKSEEDISSKGHRGGKSPKDSYTPLLPPSCPTRLQRSVTMHLSSGITMPMKPDKENSTKKERIGNCKRQESIRRPPPKPPTDCTPLSPAASSPRGGESSMGDIYTFIDPADRNDVRQPFPGQGVGSGLGMKFVLQSNSITGDEGGDDFPPPLPSRPAPKLKSPITCEPCLRSTNPLSYTRSVQAKDAAASHSPLPSKGVACREPIYDVIPENLLIVHKRARREYEEVILPDFEGEKPRLWVPPEREKLQLQGNDEQQNQQQQRQHPQQQQLQEEQQQQRQHPQQQQLQEEQQQQKNQQQQQQQVDEWGGSSGKSSGKSSPFVSKRNSSSSCGSGGGTPLMTTIHQTSKEDTISSCSSGGGIPLMTTSHQTNKEDTISICSSSSGIPTISVVHPASQDHVGSRLAVSRGNTSLDIADLRENWREEDVQVLPPSPVVLRKHAMSFHGRRDLITKTRTRCPRSHSSDKLKISTLDPPNPDTAMRRSCSLDRMDDCIDKLLHNTRCLVAGSSSEDEDARNTPVSSTGATFQDLPTVPNNDSPYRVPRSGSKPAGPYLVPPDMEPLYQYINTAEFLDEEEEDEEEEEKEDKENQLNLARQLSLRRLWCELPEVIQSGILKVLTAEERKLQEAMFEVISSESTYLRSLDVLIQNFMDDPGMNPNLPEGRRVIDKRQHHVIFSNVKEVREVSAQFLSRLQSRQRESAVVKNIADIILEFAESKFDCYIIYCTNQVYQVREMQDIIEVNLMFREYLRRLESDEVCQNLTMMSFLLLPMQRITRLPLLILAILNRTPLDHPDYGVVEATLRCVQTLVMACNDGARKMDRTEQLHEIHKRLDFGKLKPFPIVSASRQLERRGVLVQLQVENKVLGLGKNRVTKKPLHIFVFTDYIIISKMKKDARGEELFRVKDYASRALVEVEWLETEQYATFPKPGEHNSISRAMAAVSMANAQHGILLLFLDNASGRREDYILLAQNDTDRTRWIESMARLDADKNDTTETIYQHWDCPQVQAVYDYQAQQPDELGLDRGDVVKVYRKMADGWYEGERLRDLQCGWFPSNFTTEVENEHTRARYLRQTHKLNSSIDKDGE